MSGKRCALCAFIGNWCMANSAVCVDVMMVPSGSFTCIPSFVSRLSTHSLWICKKWHVVPESAIAMRYLFKTAAAYKYDFIVAFTFIAGFTIGLFNKALIYDCLLFTFFVVLSSSKYELHKLMSSVIVLGNTLLWSTLICGSCQTTKLRLLWDPYLLSTKVTSWRCSTAGVSHVSLPWVSWMSYPWVWQ